MRFVLLLLLTSLPSYANIVLKVTPVESPSVSLSSQSGEVYYQSDIVNIPWSTSNLEIPSISEEKVVLRFYNTQDPTNLSSTLVNTSDLPKLLVFFRGDSNKHFVSTPKIHGGQVLLRNPDTMEVIYEHYTSTNMDNWVLEPYVLDNFEGEYVLIDIVGGAYLQTEGVDSPFWRQGTEDTHLYSMVRKEALYEGSVTTSMFTHISYLSMSDNKNRLTNAEYHHFMEENNKRLVATGFTYNFSDPEKALYLRPKDQIITNPEYLLLPSILTDDIFINKTTSLLDAFFSMSQESFSEDVLKPYFRNLTYGWNIIIDDAKSTSVLVGKKYPNDVSFDDFVVMINGDTLEVAAINDNEDQIFAFTKRVMIDSDNIEITATPPLGMTVSWVGCDNPPGPTCELGNDKSYEIFVKASLY